MIVDIWVVNGNFFNIYNILGNVQNRPCGSGNNNAYFESDIFMVTEYRNVYNIVWS